MRRVATSLLAFAALLAAPASAQLATTLPSSRVPPEGGTLSTMVDDALEALGSESARIHRGFAADARVPGERAGELVTTLLMNGLSQLPPGGTLEIELREGELSVWVPNEAVRFDTERTALDPSGNTYHIVTRAGRGSRMTARL